MSRMVRKQIYIEEEQDAVLKEMAAEYGVSQAELIRRAIERAVTGRGRVRVRYPEKIRRKALEDFLRFARSRASLPSGGEAYKWNRQDAYEERESRYDRKE